MTMKHFSEADLLETYYLQPGQSMPVMMHLASCQECAARYERLERKLREAAVCSTEKPDTFWARQRLSVARRIAAVRPQPLQLVRPFRVAAAAALAFFLGGAVVYQTVHPQFPHHWTEAHAPAVASAAPSTASSGTVKANGAPQATEPSADPWQSEELRDFHAVVQWESWMPETKTKGANS